MYLVYGEMQCDSVTAIRNKALHQRLRESG